MPGMILGPSHMLTYTISLADDTTGLLLFSVDECVNTGPVSMVRCLKAGRFESKHLISNGF